MKRIIVSLLILSMLMSAVPICASADISLPFTLAAPTNVSVVWGEENDSPTTMYFAYSMTNEMSKFLKDKETAANSETEGSFEDFMAPYGCEDMWLSLQIDWALDDVNDEVSGWHYTKYWDYNEHTGGFGYDEDGRYHCSTWDGVDEGLIYPNTVNDVWIMRGVLPEFLDGSPDWDIVPLKDQLREDQYTYDYENEALFIDFDEHTAYFRARFVLTVRTEEKDTCYYSDWSDTTGYGKDVAKIEKITKDDLPAPVISSLRLVEEKTKDVPVVAFTLTVPEELAKINTQVVSDYGQIRVFIEARIKGTDNWIVMGNADYEVRTGELECWLYGVLPDGETYSKEDDIELRCYYCCSQQDVDDFNSDYSQIITLGIEKTSVETTEGDLNYDNILDIIDVVILRAHIVGSKVITDAETLKRGDMNKDNSNDIIDIAMMRSRIINGEHYEVTVK